MISILKLYKEMDNSQQHRSRIFLEYKSKLNELISGSLSIQRILPDKIDDEVKLETKPEIPPPLKVLPPPPAKSPLLIENKCKAEIKKSKNEPPKMILPDKITLEEACTGTKAHDVKPVWKRSISDDELVVNSENEYKLLKQYRTMVSSHVENILSKVLERTKKESDKLLKK